MLQYLIVLLDDTSTSFCHYENKKTEKKLIDLNDLKEAILFALKRNLTLQFIYPEYTLPQEYDVLIETVPHNKIASFNSVDAGKADIVVVNEWKDLRNMSFNEITNCVWRTSKNDFFNHHHLALNLLGEVARLNIIITNVETFVEEDFEDYEKVLSTFSDRVEEAYKSETTLQFNLLTDRMMLEKMNNCNAGWEGITLAPDGQFYVCPAFYQEGASPIGDLARGLEIKNPQLYKLDHAPICRNCDAYQCRRCIWINKKTTMEVNTPSHEQCVVAHLERNASRKLLENIRQYKTFLQNQEIDAIDYLDPFEVRKKW